MLLLAAVAAYYSMAEWLRGRYVLHFIDNVAAACGFAAATVAFAASPSSRNHTTSTRTSATTSRAERSHGRAAPRA